MHRPRRLALSPCSPHARRRRSSGGSRSMRAAHLARVTLSIAGPINYATAKTADARGSMRYESESSAFEAHSSNEEESGGSRRIKKLSSPGFLVASSKISRKSGYIALVRRTDNGRRPEMRGLKPKPRDVARLACVARASAKKLAHLPNAGTTSTFER